MVKALLPYLALAAAALSPARGLLDGFPSLEPAEARASLAALHAKNYDLAKPPALAAADNAAQDPAWPACGRPWLASLPALPLRPQRAAPRRAKQPDPNH